MIILNRLPVLICTFWQRSEIFRTFQSQNFSSLPTIIIRLKEHNLNVWINVFRELRGVKTSLNIVFIGSRTIIIWEWFSIQKKSVHHFHSVFKHRSFCFLIDLVLPDSAIDKYSDFSFSVIFYCVGPCQSTNGSVPDSNNYNLNVLLIVQHVFFIELNNGIKYIYCTFKVQNFIFKCYVWITEIRSTITWLYDNFGPCCKNTIWWKDSIKSSKWCTPIFARTIINEISFGSILFTIGDRVIKSVTSTPSFPNVFKIDEELFISGHFIWSKEIKSILRSIHALGSSWFRQSI